ncbi:MAG: hypothetical protein K2X03_12450 [Bryobacteraceae bacterium]|nr:hypothetical protein [Bryobacteraceae bacterium]
MILLTSQLSFGQGGLAGLGGGGGFGGPSILGRGGAGNGRKGDGLRVRPHLGVQAIYDSGLTSIRPGTETGVFTRGAAGIEVIGGVYGTKVWKRNQLQLSYLGDYRHYRNFEFWNGTDQSVDLSYGTIVTKKLSLQGSVNAGTTNRAFGGAVNPGGLNNTDAIGGVGLPTNSLFDVRTNYGGVNGTLTYNLSNRTSISLSGGGYTVRRRNRALVGVDGLQTRADVTRRINKRNSVGIDYSFMTFQFSRSFGDSYIHGLGVFWARQIGRRWELNARLGALRVETLGQRTVLIDPAIAAIIGVSSGQEVFYNKPILGSGTIALTRNAPSGSLTTSFSRSVNPGNGIILTSQMDQGGATYTRRLSRNLNFNAGYTYMRLRSVGQIQGNFKAHTGGAGFGWQVAKWAQLTARYDRRNSVTESFSAFNLNGNRVSFGVNFTPSDIPVSLW